MSHGHDDNRQDAAMAYRGSNTIENSWHVYAIKIFGPLHKPMNVPGAQTKGMRQVCNLLGLLV